MKESFTFLKTILKKKDCVVLAISGGPDSMCLFDLILSLKDEYDLKIIVAHCNHNQRQESDEEETFVKKICEKNNCIFETTKFFFETAKDFENQARKKRYTFFEELVKKYNANYLMTAHHGDDLMETILMRMVRGSNFKGYTGIQTITDYKEYKLIRPLLFTTKEKILAYNQEKKIEYRLDKTNFEDSHTRNRYRKQILPFLKQENKNVHQKFLQFSEELLKIEKYLEDCTNTVLTSVYDFGKVNLHEFKKLDLVLQKRVIEYILKEEYQNDISELNERHISLIMNLCHSKKANAKVNLPKKKSLIKDYDTLYFIKEKEKKEKSINEVLEDKVILNDRESIIKIKKTDILKSNYILRLNSKELALPLKVRTRKQTDRMQIKNMEGSKKIKDIFINEKISIEKRNTWPIVVDKNDTILWIPGVKKSNFDKNNNEFYDIIYKYVISEEKKK